MKKVDLPKSNPSPMRGSSTQSTIASPLAKAFTRATKSVSFNAPSFQRQEPKKSVSFKPQDSSDQLLNPSTKQISAYLDSYSIHLSNTFKCFQNQSGENHPWKHASQSHYLQRNFQKIKPAESENNIETRIGGHRGPVILKNNNLFGQAPTTQSTDNLETRENPVKTSQTPHAPSRISGESFDGSNLNGKSEKKVYLLQKNSLSHFNGDVSGSADGNLDGE
jgi:hypothetical protein